MRRPVLAASAVRREQASWASSFGAAWRVRPRVGDRGSSARGGHGEEVARRVAAGPRASVQVVRVLESGGGADLAGAAAASGRREGQRRASGCWRWRARWGQQHRPRRRVQQGRARAAAAIAAPALSSRSCGSTRGAADAAAGTSTTVGPRSPRRLSLCTAAAAPDLDSGVVPFARRRAHVGVVRADPAAPPPPAAERRGAAGAECRVQEGGERQRRSGAAWPCSLHELGHAGGPARAPPRELGRAPWRVSSSSVSRARPCHGGLLELGRIWRPWRGMCASGKGGRTIRCRLGCSRGRGAPLLSPNRFGADGRGNGSL